MTITEGIHNVAMFVQCWIPALISSPSVTQRSPITIAQPRPIDRSFGGPVFAVSWQQLRDEHLGEVFVRRFARGWPQHVAT
ncbi:MAG: hypothetical protein Q4D79_13750 [Propionibacteriaceae bacterium]|nr:hypothetical protein [Propionibacteriaceae bacterium]